MIAFNPKTMMCSNIALCQSPVDGDIPSVMPYLEDFHQYI